VLTFRWCCSTHAHTHTHTHTDGWSFLISLNNCESLHTELLLLLLLPTQTDCGSDEPHFESDTILANCSGIDKPSVWGI